ncbi:MAG: cytochrome c oxidase assembly protein [Gammaproteobacteria bacterium]|nr:cytochrome c oxidase assembly protein [Gammaproteobacteria bacterium]
MFVFAIWIMPPMYDLFCDITGLNGKTSGEKYIISENTVSDSETVNASESDSIENNNGLIDTTRTIKVQFIATNNEGMPWRFKPEMASIRAGEETVINYLAHNPTDRYMVAQAIPSVVPYKAASYFHKTECFCFNQQPLDAGQSAELGLSFVVDKDLPKQVNTITLSYTLFDISENKNDESTKTLAAADGAY